MKITIVILLLFFSVGLCAQTLVGKAVNISDGDTFTLLLEGKKKTVRVRLYGIDCPERSQHFGKVATDHVRNLLSGKVVSWNSAIQIVMEGLLVL
jgi:micrococcal nuclease